jgi:hypothetical protein
MKIGEQVECAIWLDGTESDAMLRQWKADCAYMMATSQEPKLRLGPLMFELKRPGEDRVPQVPDHLTGPDVRLLVAMAEFLGYELVATESFVDGLDKKDLLRLRKATRKAHGGNLPDAVCDQIIDRLGPVAAGTLH